MNKEDKLEIYLNNLIVKECYLGILTRLSKISGFSDIIFLNLNQMSLN